MTLNDVCDVLKKLFELIPVENDDKQDETTTWHDTTESTCELESEY